MSKFQIVLWVSRVFQAIYGLTLAVVLLLWMAGWLVTSDGMILIFGVGLLLIFISKALKAVARLINGGLRFGNGLMAGGYSAAREVPLIEVELFDSKDDRSRQQRKTRNPFDLRITGVLVFLGTTVGK